MSLRDPGFVPRSKVFIVSNTWQCAPGVFNLDQKLHGLSWFWDLYIYETVQNRSRKISVIGLLNFNNVNIPKKCPNQASFSIENLSFNPKKGGVESAQRNFKCLTLGLKQSQDCQTFMYIHFFLFKMMWKYKFGSCIICFLKNLSSKNFFIVKIDAKNFEHICFKHILTQLHFFSQKILI